LKRPVLRLRPLAHPLRRRQHRLLVVRQRLRPLPLLRLPTPKTKCPRPVRRLLLTLLADARRHRPYTQTYTYTLHPRHHSTIPTPPSASPAIPKPPGSGTISPTLCKVAFHLLPPPLAVPRTRTMA